MRTELDKVNQSWQDKKQDKDIVQLKKGMEILQKSQQKKDTQGYVVQILQ